jgi:hypothetical protein
LASISPKRFLAAAVAMVFLGLTLALFRFVGEAEAFPQRRSLAEFPSRLGEWRCPRRILMREGIARIAQVDDYLLCNYERETQSSANEYVNVYVAPNTASRAPAGTSSTQGSKRSRQRGSLLARHRSTDSRSRKGASGSWSTTGISPGVA